MSHGISLQVQTPHAIWKVILILFENVIVELSQVEHMRMFKQAQAKQPLLLFGIQIVIRG